VIVSTAIDIQSQINRTVGYLVKVGLAVDQNLAYLRSAGNNSMEVTFPGSENISLAMKDRSYGEIYENLAQERAYSAKMPDGALILMRYLFCDGVLQRHNLCFFPAPHLEEFQSNPEIYLEDELYADVVAKNIVPSPFRFDCDCREDVAKPVEHPKSHFTLGQYENCRIPVSAPVIPYCFISFVLRNFYHTAYTKYADNMPHYEDAFNETILSLERKLVYFQIPCA
jgi:hypothetical protein